MSSEEAKARERKSKICQSTEETEARDMVITPIVPLSLLKCLRLNDLHVSPGTRQLKGMAVVCYLKEEARAADEQDMVTVMVADGILNSNGKLMIVGKRAYLVVSRAIKAGATPDEIRLMFPVGVEVAIKEPLITALEDDDSTIPVIAVMSPDAVEFTGKMGFPEGFNSSQIRKLGDEELAKSNFVLARLYYSEAYRRAEADSVGVGAVIDKVFAMSNRAEVFLRMRRYDEAIADAEQALNVTRRHCGSNLRKARALSAMQEHKQALELLRSSMEYSSTAGYSPQEVAMISKSHMICNALVYQSEHPEVFQEKISEYLLKGRIPDQLMSDYVGPVVVSPSPGRRRGLFVTRKVKAGELLIVSNCIGIAHKINNKTIKQIMSRDLETDVINTCRGNSRMLAQLYALDTEDSDGDVIPDMAIYRPNRGSLFLTETYNSIDPGKVERIVRTHAIVIPNSWEGIWGLPCFINHSCLPNADFLRIGKVMFVHATQNLKGGEEIFMSYIEPLLPWNLFRMNKISNFCGFSCECKRCVMERMNLNLLPEVELDSRDMHLKPLIGGDNAASTIRKFEQKLIGATFMSEQEKCWIRGGYANLYIDAGEESGLTLEKVITILNSVAQGRAAEIHYVFKLCVSRWKEMNSQVEKLVDETCIAGFGKISGDALKTLERKLIKSQGRDAFSLKLGNC